MRRYAYFPGCATETTARSAELASRFVFDAIAVDLVEIDDWNCCGATSAHSMSESLGLALPARPLAQAEADFPDCDVVTGCASCYSRLKLTNYRVRQDEGTRRMVENIIGAKYEAKNEVLNFLDILNRDELRESVKNAILRPFKELNVACYYGCLNIRPAEVTNANDRENPQSMDTLVALTGATPISWGFKTECCGAARQNDAAAESRRLVHRILKNARDAGAQMIITACPMCNMNLEMRQDGFVERYGPGFIPVLSLTELLALAMGAGGKRLQLDTHHVPVMGLVAKALRGTESEVAI